MYPLAGLADVSSGAIGVGSTMAGGARPLAGAGAIVSGRGLAGGRVVVTEDVGAGRGRGGTGAWSRD